MTYAAPAVRSLLVALLLLAPACGDDDDDAAATADAAGLPGADAGADAGLGDYVTLIAADWDLVAGQEGYLCASKTLTQDIYVGAIRPIGPPGTHHTTVDVTEMTGPDDPGSPCGVGFGTFWASGAGTTELVLPDGVGLVAHAGQQLHLNLHLFNASESPLSGTSGVEVRLLDPGAVQHEATVSLHGPLGFSIPASAAPYTFTGTEELPGGHTIVAIFPHMHQIGSHFTAKVLRAGGPVTLWDEAYQFESQEFSAITPLALQAGDVLETTCTWVNTTGQPIGWGDSSTAEMCFTILMSY